MSDVIRENIFIFTSAAWIIMATNGSLSAASSILIMSIIIRSSPEARYSAYHIIMFFMSFWDTIASIAIALNTIPMPGDVFDIYPFAGKALGTIATCNIQGFFIQVGTLFVFGSNTTLNLFYVCIFRYNMSEETFKRWIMPVMLALYTAASVGLSTYAWRMDLINPVPYINSCLSLVAYPLGCTSDPDLLDNNIEGVGEESNKDIPECIRGEQDSILPLLAFVFLNCSFVILVISLVLVLATVFDAELGIRKGRRALEGDASEQVVVGDNRNRRSRNHVQDSIEDFRRTISILIQALMYISAFLLTYVWVIPIRRSDLFDVPPTNTVTFFNIFFRPLQGFFNAMIFIYQKAHTLRRSNRALTICGAFKQVVISPSTVPETIVSQIEIAAEEIGIRRQGQDLQRYPGSLTTEQRQEIAHNSGMRRFGYEIDNTPPASILSGVGSSSLGRLSFGDMTGSNFDHDSTNFNHDDHNNDDDEDEGNPLGGFGERSSPSSPSASFNKSRLHVSNDDEVNPSYASFSLDSTLDS